MIFGSVCSGIEAASVAWKPLGWRASQFVQPHQHGDPFVKTTGLWLTGLPLLVPSNPVAGREQRCWKMAPGPDREKERSRTYPGIAEAMAAQWGSLPRQADLFAEAA